VSYNARNHIVEALKAICSCVDLWCLARDEGLVPDTIARAADIVEAPYPEDFDIGPLKMGHHKVHVRVICEESNLVRIGTGEIFRVAVDIEKQAILCDI
jgi:hypothetical protein